MKKDHRFVVKHNETADFCNTRILVDTQTGVNYLMTISGYGGGLTPLLDAEGKVVVDPPKAHRAQKTNRRAGKNRRGDCISPKIMI